MCFSERNSTRIIYTRSDLYNIGQLPSSQKGLNPIIINTLKGLKLMQYRGNRGGQYGIRRAWDTNNGVNVDNLQLLPQEITKVNQRRRIEKSLSMCNVKNLIRVNLEHNTTVKGQTNIKICLMNTRSVKNKTLSICDFILSNEFDICAITETWLGSSVDKVCISELVPPGYKMKHVPRVGRRGGGVAIIHKASIQVTTESSSQSKEFSQFEFMDCNVVIGRYSMRLAVIYRPPPSKQNGLNTNTFLDHEWPLFLTKYATVDNSAIIVGDLNLHLDIPDNNDTRKFTSNLDACGMHQHVREPTHVAGHTLDVVISRETDNIVSNIKVVDPGLSDSSGNILRDHFAVTFDVKASKPAPVRKLVSYRKLRAIDIDSFRDDIRKMEFFNKECIPSDIDGFMMEYSDSLTSILDKHAPIINKNITLRPACPWYTEQLHEAKHEKRKLERKWRETKLTIDHQIYRTHCSSVNKMLKQARVEYYTSKIESCGNDHKSLSKITKGLLGDTNEVILPFDSSSERLAQKFSDFFIGKIETIRNNIRSQTQSVPDNVDMESEYTGVKYTVFAPTTEQEVKALIKKSATKSCELDPIPTWLLKECLDELTPVITSFINVSLDAAYVPIMFKHSRIRPLLKKPNLDPNELKNYRPVSNLPFLSKILEKVVDVRLESHLKTNNLHEVNQSAYRKFHSPETALLK
ncbi:uncharacterized protein LOC132722906, partial [Ruditapes philippinarum]|uniref:uncharacterized protein LOC132722906 n=1 Tax=Ruditapes philippinarum TaxID=129788 RepID=UPI00295B0A5A